MKIESKVVVTKIGGSNVHEVGQVGNVTIYSNISDTDSDEVFLFYYVSNNKVLGTIKVAADCCQNYGSASYDFVKVE